VLQRGDLACETTTHPATAPGEGTREDDVVLLSAVAHGDRHAYAALHRRYASTLLGLLVRLLGSRQEGEDVLQEVFLQVWKRAGDFDPRRGCAFVWLATVARSRALDRMSVIASRSRLTAERVCDGCPEDAADPAAAASLAEEARRVRTALARIPDGQRQVLLLAYFEGLSQSEIAHRLGIPLGTVKSHARLGLSKMRDLLGAGGDTGLES
jgi:RNA polymerase sigma-70 factor (ECF subfamily)